MCRFLSTFSHFLSAWQSTCGCARCCLCIATLPFHAAWAELSRTSPTTNSTTPRTDLLFLRRALPFCSHWHKQNTYTALSCLSKAAFLWRVPSQLSCRSHAPIDSGCSQLISFTAVCDGSMKTQTCLWSCFRFSGITQGGKQRLIKSTGSPRWVRLSIRCCLLITATQWGASLLIQFKVYGGKRGQITSPAVIMLKEDSFLVKLLWGI